MFLSRPQLVVTNHPYRSAATDKGHRLDYLDQNSSRPTNRRLTAISHPLACGRLVCFSVQQLWAWPTFGLVIWWPIRFRYTSVSVTSSSRLPAAALQAPDHPSKQQLDVWILQQCFPNCQYLLYLDVVLALLVWCSFSLFYKLKLINYKVSDHPSI